MDNSDLSNGRLQALNDDLETSLPNNDNKATFGDLDKCVENILSWESVKIKFLFFSKIEKFLFSVN